MQEYSAGEGPCTLQGVTAEQSILSLAPSLFTAGWTGKSSGWSPCREEASRVGQVSQKVVEMEARRSSLLIKARGEGIN